MPATFGSLVQMGLDAVAGGEYFALVEVGVRLLKPRLLFLGLGLPLRLTCPSRPLHHFDTATSLAARNGSAAAGSEDSGEADLGAVSGVVDGFRGGGISVGHPTAHPASFDVQIRHVPPYPPSVLPCLFYPVVGHYGEVPFACGLVLHFADNPLHHFGDVGDFLGNFQLVAGGF